MKNDNGAKSQGKLLPWVKVSYFEAVSACRAIGKGFDLISNDQWQTIANDIVNLKANWSKYNIGEGELNVGHSDGFPFSLLEASEYDSRYGCFQTGQICNFAEWDSQRRTHFLSNGDVIWDLAGNAMEWVKDDISVVGIKGAYSANLPEEHFMKLHFSTNVKLKCKSSDIYNNCGLGYVGSSYDYKSIARGGDYNFDAYSGIFSTEFSLEKMKSFSSLGFRCVYSFKL